MTVVKMDGAPETKLKTNANKTSHENVFNLSYRVKYKIRPKTIYEKVELPPLPLTPFNGLKIQKIV